ncbi:MAG: CehA/McbA family metallohydrolase [Myxococcota bacterium]
MFLAWIACRPPDPVPPGVEPPTGPVDIAAEGFFRGDLHFHTNYSDDALEQGGDWMRGALDIAAAWADPAWVEAFPELAPTDHLQFVAVTDHRTTAGWDDPEFRSDTLAVLGGEEFGSDGHAGIWGHDAHVPHEPQHGETPTERIRDAIDEAHAQGGLFSVNHPLYSGDLWTWDATGFDGVEVWNAAWSAMGAPSTEVDLDQWLVDHGGAENPWIRPAVRAEGVPQNGQALRFWYSVLSSGNHVPPVGGGDRHMIFPAGLPTTYVAASERTPEAILAGLAAGATFVSRSPQGPQVVLEAEVDGQTYPLGSALPGGPATIRWRVGRAAGGELRLIQGRLGTDGEPERIATVPLTSADATGVFEWTPPTEGGWVHAVVVDPLPTDVPDEMLPAVEALTTFPADGGLTAVLSALGPLVDLAVLGDPAQCRLETWTEWSGDCMPVDTEPFATFYVPPNLQALLATDFEGGQATGYAMGAISAAFFVGG